ncbi:hypothetical protein GCM10007916_08610 [Psychromonas marina]|uniref:DUF304 domain-containing protein n=1 Tax=Psychromonas marina TaxID=88364 RepID=A0ABQ6DXA7_9GAMM|nr:hypothetical protein [Psychromonas marina]GLS89794.1 hypothetical protein GCM10007916_08610 [Psychromonas marina]
MDKKDFFTIDLKRPLLRDGPNFLSHTVIVIGDIAYLRPTISSMMFCMIYVVVGSFLLSLATYLLIVSTKYDLVIFLGGFGIAITTFGISLIRPFLQRASFNKQLDIFNNHKDRDVKLHHITSLHINNKIIQRKHALSYPCFELNLLTAHGRRINVLNHNDQQQLQQDAQLLATFLGIELHDCRKEVML